VPYNELVVTTDYRDDTALNRAAAELSAHDSAAIAVDLHRLDEASTLVDVLRWVVECSRRRSTEATLFIVKGSALQPWRDSGDAPASRAGRPFALNVGGRVVAVLVASPLNPQAVGALDILTRYASRTLESMTLHKALGLVPPRAKKMGSGVI
jgi:hypothetical protein